MNQQADIDAIWPLLDRPLWVVTAGTPTKPGGLIATWVTQSSLSPQTPHAVIGIAPNHHTAKLIDEHNAFGLHLLASNQLSLVERFAGGSGRDTDKLAGLATREWEKCPVLKECASWAICRVFARLDAGDRIFYWADLERGAAIATDPNSILRESHLSQLPRELLQRLRDDRERDIDLQRPMAAAWRDQLPDSLQPKQNN